MTLSFSTCINGKPTHFVEKIWAGLYADFPAQAVSHDHCIKCICHGYDLYAGRQWAPKRHTIRAYGKREWRPGMTAHLVVHNRTPHRFEFAQVIVKEVQHIEIWIMDETEREVIVDLGKPLTPQQIEDLARNDGFDLVEDFWTYFDKPHPRFEGVIIHWSDLIY